MRLLILGGTEFVGRAFADEARSRGWEVTVFHRGRHPAPAHVTVLHGDRTAPDGPAALEAGEWDLVVDTWRGAPVHVRRAARLLKERARHYTYVSSRSVYAYPAAPGLDEDGPLEPGDPDSTDTAYAGAKRGGELAALAEFGDRALLARAGLVLGPGENVGRLPWWLNWVARGGDVLAPGPRELPIQYIDARDLAIWCLEAAAEGRSGAYNLVSPRGHATMGELLEACVEATGAGAELRWVEPELLTAAGVEPWTQLPIWIPPGELHSIMHQATVAKAVAAGLTCRPLAETVADTWAWQRELPGRQPAGTEHSPTGITPELAAELLSRGH
ncbi:reductase [Streptomyces tateyamensis]|uniref:Reductase n=1 Tax=Streptomyces tateyamensis TaxID=565073 RepID=A0A2V4NH39_9ACTN|nr:NAD-dependent epimerase/dehydratase family protein [Streptomyces tateyamensis]PYC78582.1 reductase [Streptomyces tateyamensis]